MFNQSIRFSSDQSAGGGAPSELKPTTSDILIPGQGQHTGYAVAKSFILQFETKPVPERRISSEEVPGELDRLDRAARELEAQFKSLIDTEKNSAPAALSDSIGYVHESTTTMREARRLISAEKLSAEYAVQKVFDDLFELIDGDFTRDRAYEALDVKHRLLKLLYPAGSDITAQLREQLASISEPVVLFIENLSPAQALQISAFQRKSGLIKGLVIKNTSHIGHQDLVLRDLALPVMGGIDFKPLVDAEKLAPGEDVVLDVELGHIKLKLSASSRVEAYRKSALIEAPEEVSLSSHAPRTRDGVQMRLLGDLLSPEQMNEFTKRRILSIGLVRTELGVLERNRWLSEEEQCQEYTRILQSASPASVSLRTYDFGFDKVPDFLSGSLVSASGLRGIRLMQELFEEEQGTQARALLRAAYEVGNDVRIIIPMVFNAGEMVRIRELFDQSSQELVRRGAIARPPQNVSIGAMVETSSSVAMINAILAESDFVSIGTRDLLLSILGGDLSKSSGAHYDPAFLFSVRKVVHAARAADKDVYVCGEMPCHTQNIPLLVGIGATNLVVNHGSAGKVNAMIAACDSTECAALVDRMIESGDDKVAYALRNEFLEKLNIPG